MSNKGEFIDEIMEHCLAHLRADHPELSEIESAKYYATLICEKLWSNLGTSVIKHYMIQSLLNKKTAEC